MKKSTRKWVSCLAAVTAAAATATTAFADWSSDGKGGWRWLENGVSASGWRQIDNHWYHFSASGQMETGWLQLDGNWYFLKANGQMAAGWVKDGKNWFHLGPDGIMDTGWLNDSGKLYYLNETGSMAVGWKDLEGEWHYMNQGGDMATGWVTISGQRYFLDASGAMQTGVIKIGEDTYYFDDDGAMQTGDVVINGRSYHFDLNGKATGRIPSPDKYFTTGGNQTDEEAEAPDKDHNGTSNPSNNPTGTGDLYEGITLTSAKAVSDSEILVTLNKAAPAKLALERFSIARLNGNPVTLHAISTGPEDENKVYLLRATSMPAGNYTITLTLPNGKRLVSDFSCAALPSLVANPKTVRTESSAATLSFTAAETGTLYCLPVSQKQRAASHDLEEILADGEAYAIKKGENKISIEGLSANTAYDLYLAAENIYQEAVAYNPVEVNNIIEAPAAAADEGMVIEDIDTTEPGITVVALSYPTEKALTAKDFRIYCPSGTDMAVARVTTKDKQTYSLSTSYYRDNTYYLEVKLPGGKVLQQSFASQLDCPLLNGETAVRTSGTTAEFAFASDTAGYLYYKAVPKTTARIPSEDELKKGERVRISDASAKTQIAGLKANTAYTLYYIAVDTTIKNRQKTTPILSLEIPAAPAGVTVKSCVAASDSQARIVLEGASGSLSAEDFTLSCPRGQLKIEKVTAEGNGSYLLSLRTGSTFANKVNYIVTAKLPDGTSAQGLFYTDLYGPSLTVNTAYRYAGETVSVKCSADRAGYVYCMPSPIAYDANGYRPTIAEVVAKGKKLPLVFGSNTLSLNGVPANYKTIWYVTENASGARQNHIDYFTIPDTLTEKPSVSDLPSNDGYNTIASISGTSSELKVVPKAPAGNLSIAMESGDITISGENVTLNGQSDFVLTSYNGKYYTIAPRSALKPGKYQLDWTYSLYIPNENIDVPLTTVSIQFTISSKGKVIS